MNHFLGINNTGLTGSPWQCHRGTVTVTSLYPATDYTPNLDSSKCTLIQLVVEWARWITSLLYLITFFGHVMAPVWGPQWRRGGLLGSMTFCSICSAEGGRNHGNAPAQHNVEGTFPWCSGLDLPCVHPDWWPMRLSVTLEGWSWDKTSNASCSYITLANRLTTYKSLFSDACRDIGCHQDVVVVSRRGESLFNPDTIENCVTPAPQLYCHYRPPWTSN